MNQLKVQEAVPGIQLAIFEIIWPVKGISHITYRAAEDSLDVRFQATHDLSAEDRDACERLMSEILVAASQEIPNLASAVSFIAATDDSRGFEVLMSPSVAEEIAKRHAPWRSKEMRNDV